MAAGGCDCAKHRSEGWLTGIEREGLRHLVEKFAVLKADDLRDPNEPSIKRELLKLRGEVDPDGVVHFFPREADDAA